MKLVSAEEAISVIKSGDRVFIQGVAAYPQTLVRAMTERASELKGVEIYHLHTEGDADYVRPEFNESFHTNAFFIGSNIRKAIETGMADYIPTFLSEIPTLFRREIIPIDVALVHVSPPDKHGYCSLGTSIDITLAGVQMAECVVAQINRNMPRTHGDGLIHIDEIDYGVTVKDELPENKWIQLTDAEIAIGKHCAELIEDGSTLQMGIGAIPNAVLVALKNHKDLGIHSEMFSNRLIDLLERGVVNGKFKKVHKNKVVASFVLGTRKLYDYIDDNPEFMMLGAEYVNNPQVICRNPKVVAINSAIEVDLTGQVCADSIGERLYSGVGGQMDFMRGAAISEGGKPVITLASTTRRGESKIVPILKKGAGVVTTRAHTHYVVTEFGAVNLYGKTLRERAKALIKIAHPNHREKLEKAAHERFKIL